ncbi:microfibril-associated glycoprotein 4-like [Drosophila sulfurigaster albostrigata]|uniref:microfibril-associated glycoprotein 4-like n=1 Tax=Drosophila sulfurigaster albostrigata TaxID=89887 RepID=UPI002D2184AC|nr:microfibril-associated glycoprotein 4-like [Drosophila sulfurigaster albostrigata]
MNLSTYTYILTILLVFKQVNSSCSVYSKELDDQCSTHCYQVVKPLLQYVNTVQSPQHAINSQADEIKNLNELIKSRDIQQAQQIKLSESCESQNQYQKKLIDQYEIQLTTKDKEIKDLQSQVVKPKESKETSSCLGKLTEIHEIRLPTGQSMIVPCESNLLEAGAGWTVIQRRKDNGLDFRRTWSEYKDGFGNLRGEFFFGLEKIHLLTQSQPHELFIFIERFSNTTYARYSNFVIGDEKEFYNLKELGKYSGTANDRMEGHLHEKISAADVEDFTLRNCDSLIFANYFRKCYWW